ncbi:hypothetical protein [Roseobacter sp. A03A-229]
MTDVTRARAGLTFAFRSPKNMLRRLLSWLRPAPKGLEIGEISDHLARDIGLSPADLDRHRVTLPSQTTYHPRG